MKEMGSSKPYRKAITYGTFDLFHYGHLRLLERAAELADELIVGVATDSFNTTKGKQSMMTFEHRSAIVSALRMVTKVIPEHGWTQKSQDIHDFGADLLVMGDDWRGEFDSLERLCSVVYLPRTSGISSSQIRDAVHFLRSEEVEQLKDSLTVISGVLSTFDE